MNALCRDSGCAGHVLDARPFCRVCRTFVERADMTAHHDWHNTPAQVARTVAAVGFGSIWSR